MQEEDEIEEDIVEGEVSSEEKNNDIVDGTTIDDEIKE